MIACLRTVFAVINMDYLWRIKLTSIPEWICNSIHYKMLMKSYIISQTQRLYRLSLGMNKWFRLTIYWVNDYLSMLVSKMSMEPQVVWHRAPIAIAVVESRRVNKLRPRQNGHHFADDIFKWIFLNENARIPIKMSLKFVPRGPINKIPALVQIMAWRRPGDKPLSEPMMIRFPTHICVTRPQWVNRVVLSKECLQTKA